MGLHQKSSFNSAFSLIHKKLNLEKKRKRFENKQNYSLNEQVEHSLITLNLKPDVNEEQLKKYKALVKKYHPDVNNNISNKEMKMKEINKAYKILQNF